MADHIQLLDMPSTKSAHAASVQETGFGKSMLVLTLEGLAMSPTMMVFVKRLQVPGSRAPGCRQPKACSRPDIGNGEAIQLPLGAICGSVPAITRKTRTRICAGSGIT
jgi:hypothetical protein